MALERIQGFTRNTTENGGTIGGPGTDTGTGTVKESFKKSNSNSNVKESSLKHNKDRALFLAAKLGDQKPFFMLWALSQLPISRVEALIATALECGFNPPAYFNRLVREEINAEPRTQNAAS